MKERKTNFKGLKVFVGEKNIDKRGYLLEIYKKSFFKKKMIFDYISYSKKNVIRGMHFQYSDQQSKFISVLKGEIFDVCIDLRKNSKTFGSYFSTILSEKNSKSIFIPEGFAHGFCSLKSNSMVLYKNSKYYSQKNQFGIMWNDTDLDIDWPIKNPIISKKDKYNLSFKQFLKEIKYL